MLPTAPSCLVLIEGHCHGHWRASTCDPHATHLEAVGDARVLRGLLDVWAVMNEGFTTVFSMGHGNPNHAAAIREAVNGEGFPGPRIYHCGWAISQTAGHGNVREWSYDLVKSLKPRSLFADGPYQLRAVVRQNLGCGADFIKIYSGEGGFTAPENISRRLDFTSEEIQAIVDEAHRQGFRVASHCMTLAHAIHAAENGVDRVEHGPVLYEPGFVHMLRDTGASWCPTVSQLWWALVERESRRLSESMVSRLERGLADRARTIVEALEAGVTVGFGTDNRMRPKAGRNALEFQLMASHGVPTLDVISIGTVLAARMVGLEPHLGTVEEGKLADLIVVDGDPEKEIAVLTQPERITRILKSYRQVHLDPAAKR